ncbi:MAG: FMN-binding protein [Bacillota bacterium]
MSKKKAIIIAVLVPAVIGIVFGIFKIKSYLTQINNAHQQLMESKITDVDLSKISNGAYLGSYKAFPVAVEVKVTVTDHQITGIELLKHNNGQGGAAETITGKVVEAQSLSVDTISGATISSKVILKAIENALTGAGQ